MTAVNTLQFNGYTLRPAGSDAGDYWLAKKWTAADPEHAGVAPAFWLEQRPGVDSVLVLDGQGAVFFFKAALLDTAEGRKAQVFIQFMPCATTEDRERTREALAQGSPWLEPVLASSGVEEMFFDSRSAKLISFCVKRLGFEVHPDVRQQGKAALAGQGMLRLRKRLTPAASPLQKMEGV